MYLFKFTSISHLDSTGELGENSQSSSEIMVFKWSLEAAVAYELSSTKKTLIKESFKCTRFLSWNQKVETAKSPICLTSSGSQVNAIPFFELFEY